MNDSIRRTFYMGGVFLLMIVFSTTCEQYENTSLYWIITALLDLAFWTLAFYPNYRWRSMGFWRQIIFTLVCLKFCLYFLPIDILLSKPFTVFKQAIDTVMLVAIIWDNDDRGGGRGKKADNEEEQVDKHRLATDNI